MENRNDLAGALSAYFNRNQPLANLPPLTRPAVLNDPNTAPALRAQVLESYVAALTDRPSNSWTAQDKADIREQLVIVTRGM